MDAGAWELRGMVAGLIHHVPSVQELIDRIMAGVRPSSPNAWRASSRRDESVVRK